MTDHIEIDGIKYTTELTQKYLDNKDFRIKIHDDIRAFIPGLIHAVYCKPGDRIKPNAPIISLEAMKMYNEITLPDEVIIQDEYDRLLEKGKLSLNDALEVGVVIEEDGKTKEEFIPKWSRMEYWFLV